MRMCGSVITFLTQVEICRRKWSFSRADSFLEYGSGGVTGSSVVQRVVRVNPRVVPVNPHQVRASAPKITRFQARDQAIRAGGRIMTRIPIPVGCGYSSDDPDRDADTLAGIRVMRMLVHR